MQENHVVSIVILNLIGSVMLVKKFWWYSTFVMRPLKFASSVGNCFSPEDSLRPENRGQWQRCPLRACILDILHICFVHMGENRSIILSVCLVWTNCSKKVASCCDNHHYLNQWSSLVKTRRPSLKLKVVLLFLIKKNRYHDCFRIVKWTEHSLR